MDNLSIKCLLFLFDFIRVFHCRYCLHCRVVATKIYETICPTILQFLGCLILTGRICCLFSVCSVACFARLLACWKNDYQLEAKSIDWKIGVISSHPPASSPSLSSLSCSNAISSKGRWGCVGTQILMIWELWSRNRFNFLLFQLNFLCSYTFQLLLLLSLEIERLFFFSFPQKKQ